MTGRYTRKPAPLEVRGISRGTLDYTDDLSQSPDDFIKNVNEAISNYGIEDTVSGRSSPSSETQGWIPGGWNTGNTTERSSVISTITYDDEFDREASRIVRQMFEDIDSILYERCESPDNNAYSQHIQKECQDWVAQFPHLRILGMQLLPPQDHGFQAIPSETPRPSTGSVLIDVEQDTIHDSGVSGLSVHGKSVRAETAPIEPHRNIHESQPQYAHLVEEVYEQDGHYEEYVAVDCDNADEDHIYRYRHKRKHHYPPVTPSANVKDSIACSALDCVWHDGLVWMKKLLSQYTNALLGEVVERSSLDLVPNLTPSRLEQHVLANQGHSIRGLTEKQHTFPQMRTLGIHLLNSGLTESSPKSGTPLEDLLKIQTKQLTSRLDKSIFPDVLESHALRPESGIQLRSSARPGSVSYPRTGIQSATARRRITRLAPIGGIADRVRTPNVDDERPITEVRGVGLPIADRSMSPPYMFNKNGALPPIGLENTEPQPSLHKTISNLSYSKKAHFNQSRASSAVHEGKDSRMSKDKERSLVITDWNRPSTTHAFRSDTSTPFSNPRRSSTPLDYAKRGNFNNSSSFLGITGNSISNPPHAEHGQLDEDVEIIYPQLAPRDSGPINGAYRKAKQLSSMAR